MRTLFSVLTLVAVASLSIAPAWSAEGPTAPPAKADQASTDDTSAAPPDVPADSPESGLYLLRYKFQAGEAVRWHVEHRSHIRTTISGTTDSAESVSISVKAWKVSGVDEKGNVTFEHSVESVKMRQKRSGRQEETYDSLVDKTPPAIYEEAAKSVGVPLTVVKMDALGKIVRRDDKRPRPGASDEAQLTISLPQKRVSVGEKWTFPTQITLPLKEGGVKRIDLRQQYALLDVKNGIAVIRMETQVLTPIHDPDIEAQLMQRETTGEVRFDIEAGRVVAQQIDLEKSVVGIANGQGSIQCRTRFEERLLTEAPATANAEATEGGEVTKE
jgi:hypothetical protein